MKSQTRADLAMTAAIVFLGSALIFSGFSLLRLHWSGRPQALALDLPEVLGVAAAGIGIALLCWWCFALACACLSAVAHKLGAHRLSAVTAGLSPAFMRRVVAAVVGINLLTAPLAGAAQGPGIDPLWHAQTVATAPVAAGATGAASGATAVASAAAVAGQNPLAPEPPVDPLWVPNAPETDPDLLIRQPPRSDPDHSDSGTSDSFDPETGDVVVKSGDTLWGIVAQALGPYSSDVDVALAWPQWYSTNRATIGADPNLILPGQVLHAPASY